MLDPLGYANEWCAAWNDHDLDRLLAQFHEHVVFTSPAAQKIVPGSKGVVVGKTALRAYWTEGLRLIPNLRFEITGVFSGVGALAINYRNQDGRDVSEVLVFKDDMIIEGHAAYLVSPSGLG